MSQAGTEDNVTELPGGHWELLLEGTWVSG